MKSAGFNRFHILTLMAAAAAMPFAYYVRDAYALVLAVVLQEALYQILYLLPCFLVGRFIVRRMIGDDVNSAVGIATSAALGIGLVGFVVLGLGIAGRLGPTVAWAILILCTAVGLADGKSLTASLAGVKDNLPGWFRAKSARGWIWIVAALLFTIPVVGATLIPGTLWRPDDPHPYDSLIYHLQVPREWWEVGRIVPLRHNVYSYFPFNIEMHYLLTDYLRGTPWMAMQMNQFLSVSFTLLTALAMWGWVGRRWGAMAGAVATLVILSMPWVLMLACVTYVESGMLLWSLLAIVWFIDAVEKKSASRYALAGVMCGLACGTKFTGVPMLMLAMPLAVLAGLGASRFAACSARRWLVGSVVYGAVGMAVLSPWLVRNVAWAGNPVFPNAMRLLGQAHFTDTQVERFERAHRPAEEHEAWTVRGERFVEQVAVNWRFSYVTFPLALIAAIINRRRMEAVAMAALIVLVLIFWLTLTHLMGRFFVMAVLPAAILIAMLPPRWLLASAGLIAIAGINCWVGPTVSLGTVLRGTGNLHELFDYYAIKGREGLYGLQGYESLDPPELEKRIDKVDEMVLVGDAQVFHRQTPMTKLHYCTVFDLNTDGRDIFDAYYGPAPIKCPSDVLLLIDQAEAARLSRTYWKVPPVPVPPPERFKNYAIVQ